MTLGTRLQAAIRDLHTKIEELPVAQAMAGGTISRPEYGRLLVQMLHAHQALEAVLAEQPSLAGLYTPAMARTDDLLSDLAALGQPRGGRATPETLGFADEVAGWADDPSSLAGCLYVLEGSRMGSMVLAPRLARAFGVPVAMGHGLDYHVRDLERRPVLWRGFKAALESLPLDAERLLAAAERTMFHLYVIYEASAEPALQEAVA
ncbi:MAG: biliverdin-producing heme oxygenase [Gemmataceae bacterium]